MKKKILIVVGTRPNFVKITQFKKVAKKYKELEIKIVHTGQHYDKKMSAIFLEQFHIEVDYFLETKSSSANRLIGEIILKLEEIINQFSPNLLLCVGDVNSTLAAAITANKLNVKLGHLESGLRSLDREMPEEINRILTDEISDLCFVTEQSGVENLKNIGKKNEQIAFVGNTMIDTLVHFTKEIEASSILDEVKQEKYKYILVTMHRPRNVDTKDSLEKILMLFRNITKKHKVVFSIPCITLRENTERPSTIEEGTNVLMSFNIIKITDTIKNISEGKYKKGRVPRFWDGNSTERVIQKTIEFLS
jgi:UDP-N-acetylglucosamine 2-epimerase (non-hydrolysing)